MITKLFIDDRREPDYLGWKINECYFVTNGFDAWKILFSNPEIIEVTFDHDLGMNSINGYELLKEIIEWELENNKIGYILGNKLISCHSDNPDGKKNIELLWKNYKEKKLDCH